jgi:hypothetical protein
MHMGAEGVQAAGAGNRAGADRDVAPAWARVGVGNRAAQAPREARQRQDASASKWTSER